MHHKKPDTNIVHIDIDGDDNTPTELPLQCHPKYLFFTLLVFLIIPITGVIVIMLTLLLLANDDATSNDLFIVVTSRRVATDTADDNANDTIKERKAKNIPSRHDNHH